MYLDDIGAVVKRYLPRDQIPDGDVDDLFRMYAALVLAKGIAVEDRDVHNTWSAWTAKENPDHESLVEFENLDPSTRQQDVVFTQALRRTAQQLAIVPSGDAEFVETLFPNGLPTENSDNRGELIDLYKIMVESSEKLVGRRQAVNTFFLTANGALLTAYGVILKTSGGNNWSISGIIFLGIAGIVLSSAWRSLIQSFGQLNSGKFKVINKIEKHLSVAVYDAEWVALGKGSNPKIYRSFTEREEWVPKVLRWLHVFVVAGSIIYLISSISLPLGNEGDKAIGGVETPKELSNSTLNP